MRNMARTDTPDKKEIRALVTRNILSARRRGPTIMPDRYHTTLKYTAGLNLTQTGASAFRVWRGNSVYDPDSTGTGSQPNGFDELAVFYQYYRVTTINVRVDTVSGNSTATLPIIHLLYPSMSSTTYSDYADALGNPYSVHKPVPFSSNGFYSTLSLSMSTRKFFGISGAEASSDDYASAVGTNPAKQYYIHYMAQDMTMDGSALSVYATFCVTYGVTFYGRSPLSRS